MSTEATIRRLQQISQRHEEASADWVLAENGLQIMARIAPGTSPVVVLKSTDDCGWQDLEFASHAHADIDFMLKLLRQQFRNQPKAADDRRDHRPDRTAAKPADHARDCAMWSAKQIFRRFLIERHDLRDAGDQTRIDTHVRFILNVKSRAELNEDENAKQRWLKLYADFKFWRNHP